ncbi:MAG: hypothetical protein MTP17_01010 [Candidatus Midichloria sp.]|nr:MAG: hypothetical protein MTP17_01010 [Candidatus Midichloria sp.]
MKFVRSILIHSIIIVVVSLFFIKSKVRDLSKKLVFIESEIIKERDNIHILKAEFVYLSKPQNIEKLAEQHLNLQIMSSEQLVNIEISNGSKAKIFEKVR